MMLAGFFFLFLVSGVITSNISGQPKLHDDQTNFNQDIDEGLDISKTDILKPPELSGKIFFQNILFTKIIFLKKRNLSNKSLFCVLKEFLLKLLTLNSCNKVEPVHCLLLDGSTNQYSKYPELQRNYRNQNSTKTTQINQQFQDVRNNNVNCTQRAVYNHLKLAKDNNNSKMRPSPSQSPTKVEVDVLLYAILDLNEKEQQFVSYIWVLMYWRENDIIWKPEDFCGIETIYPPRDVLWMPDLTIEEMIEENKLPTSPYVTLYYDGEVALVRNMVVVSSCSMEVYKFPFDVQNCKLSFRSIVYSSKDLELQNVTESKGNLEWSLERMTQSEWLFVNFSINKESVNNFGPDQIMLVYTITMKRRSALYIANFLLPIMFLLCLDLASFGISDMGGEKLGFKVTVLLAVTVMQLILNDILPASSDRIPLIAIYCIGVFGLMMLSLVESILMTYLFRKDSASEDNWADKEQSCTDLKKRTSADETPAKQLSVAKEGDSSKPTDESIALKNISDELRDVEKTLTRVLNGSKEENKPGNWSRVAKKVNIVFIVIYVIAVIVFLTFLFSLWIKPDGM
ncbi:neuronal acetylcholine receptor subunit alpha-7-like isoform 1-T1 [Spinachia spinachia]